MAVRILPAFKHLRSPFCCGTVRCTEGTPKRCREEPLQEAGCCGFLNSLWRATLRNTFYCRCHIVLSAISRLWLGVSQNLFKNCSFIWVFSESSVLLRSQEKQSVLDKSAGWRNKQLPTVSRSPMGALTSVWLGFLPPSHLCWHMLCSWTTYYWFSDDATRFLPLYNPCAPRLQCTKHGFLFVSRNKIEWRAGQWNFCFWIMMHWPNIWRGTIVD